MKTIVSLSVLCWFTFRIQSQFNMWNYMLTRKKGKLWISVSFSSMFGSNPLQLFFSKLLWKISQDSQKNTHFGVPFLVKKQAYNCNFTSKGTPALVFSFQFIKTFQNSYSVEHMGTVASVFCYEALAWGR